MFLVYLFAHVSYSILCVLSLLGQINNLQNTYRYGEVERDSVNIIEKISVQLDSISTEKAAR